MVLVVIPSERIELVRICCRVPSCYAGRKSKVDPQVPRAFRGKSAPMNILVMPAWYPTNLQPLSGSFFQEQALLLQKGNDVRVLHCEFVSLRPAKFLKALKATHAEPPRGIRIGIPSIPKLAIAIGRMRANRCIGRWIRSGWKPDVIRAHGTIWAGYFAVVAGRKFKIPVVITEHRNPFLLDGFSRSERRKVQFAVENCATFSGDGHFALRSVVLHGFRPQSVAVLGNLVDADWFYIKPPQASRNTFTILTITSTKLFYKDFHTFVSAMIAFREMNSAKFICNIVVHEDSISDEIGQRISDHGLAENVRFHCGGVSRRDLPQFYQESDVFVSTSITENFGVAMVEALMCGIPVVATRSGGAEDFINCDNGFLVDIMDSDSIARRLHDIASREVRFSPESVRRSVYGRYSSDPFRERLMALFREVARPEGQSTSDPHSD